MFDSDQRVSDSGISKLSRSFTDGIGDEIIHLKSTSSTQDVARALALSKEAGSGTVVIADEQDSGRGRFGREWVSKAGDDILMSIVLEPRASLVNQMTIMGSLACALTVEDYVNEGISIKWPNDVLVSGKKISGVIAESFTQDRTQSVILGIGLNVNFAPKDAASHGFKATSIRHSRGGKTRARRSEIFATLLTHLNDLYDSLERGETIIPEWRSRLETLGKQVVVAKGGTRPPEIVEEGRAEDVDEFGRLLIRTRDGRLTAVSSGEVTLTGP